MMIVVTLFQCESVKVTTQIIVGVVVVVLIDHLVHLLLPCRLPFCFLVVTHSSSFFFFLCTQIQCTLFAVVFVVLVFGGDGEVVHETYET